MHRLPNPLARWEHAAYIVFKEFPPRDQAELDFLLGLGYRRFSSDDKYLRSPVLEHGLLYRSPPEPISPVCGQSLGKLTPPACDTNG